MLINRIKAYLRNYMIYVGEFLEVGYSEKEVQLKALNEIRQDCQIEIWEVTLDEE